jgi:hypothetical protein
MNRVLWKWWRVLTTLGVCCKCYRVFVHDQEEPFAYCKCGTHEWTSRPGLIPRLRDWWRS